MNPLRLVLITRRFWPLVGGAEKVTANLASQWQEDGASVTILTARWQPQWSKTICFRDVPVVRLENPASRFRGTLVYMRSVARWLRRNRGNIDLVCVSMLKHSAYAALGAVGGHVPVVLRAEGGGASGDCRWQQEARFGGWIARKCRRSAAAVIGPSPAICEELTAAGYSADRVHRIANGVAIPPTRNPMLQQAARASLAATHPALEMPAGTPLAVYTGRLHRGKGLRYLVSAWTAVVGRWPNARLWIIGEGPHRQALEDQIQAVGLEGRVVPLGTFDCVDDLLTAADLFVLPSLEEGMSVALLEAMAAGLPVVVTDIPGNRLLVDHDRHGLLVPVEDAEALSSAVMRIFGDPDRAARMGVAGRDRVAGEFSLATMAQRHRQLFESLVHPQGKPL